MTLVLCLVQGLNLSIKNDLNLLRNKTAITQIIQKERHDRKQENRAKYDNQGNDHFVSDRTKVVFRKINSFRNSFYEIYTGTQY